MNRNNTAAEKRWMGRVRELGCLIHPGTPAFVHHLQIVSPRDSALVIPLCPECHEGKFSIHNDKRNFLATHGSELRLLAETIRRLA